MRAEILAGQQVRQDALVGAVEKGADAGEEGGGDDVAVGSKETTEARLLASGHLLHARGGDLGGDADHLGGLEGKSRASLLSLMSLRMKSR